MKYCKYCGMKLRDESRFCYRCGEPCADAAATEAVRPGELAVYDEEPEDFEGEWLDDFDDEPVSSTDGDIPVYLNKRTSLSQTGEPAEPDDLDEPDDPDWPYALDEPDEQDVPDMSDNLNHAFDSDTSFESGITDSLYEDYDPDEPDEDEGSVRPRRFREAHGLREDDSPDRPESFDESDEPEDLNQPDEAEALNRADEPEGPDNRYDPDEPEGLEEQDEPEDLYDPDEEDDFEEEAGDEESRERRRKRRKTRRVIALLILAALTAYIIWSPARRAFTYAAAGQTEKAVALYKSEVFPNRVETMVLSLLAPYGIDASLHAYNKSTIHYEDAAGRIETLGTIGNAKGTADRKLNQLDTLYSSKVAFLTGEKEREEGDYEAAMQAYRKVVREDANYNAASELAAQSEELFVKDILDRTSSASANEEYESSIRILEEAGKAVPDNREISDALSGIRQKYAASLRKTAVETASSYIEQGFYKEAIDLVDEALAYNEHNADLIALKNTAVNKYETFVTEQVDIYLKNKDLDGAVALLEKASQDMPDSKAVARLYIALKES